jgi:hypothetical protein
LLSRVSSLQKLTNHSAGFRLRREGLRRRVHVNKQHAQGPSSNLRCTEHSNHYSYSLSQFHLICANVSSRFAVWYWLAISTSSIPRLRPEKRSSCRRDPFDPVSIVLAL